ncbi:sulfur carrier protein [Granulicella pectinivorans]|jgi:sulfur carrier protein|uniref:Sulfur carrier protein n=1 Tax=Granulicella pectinivorans TaxID=474950 RepID=A0A1I6MKK3_9BACT|nr:sulfur carrier protein ThiS [Granulicella pectinivorans]SFS16127.1 sulfur carrier protein [Granulicella pectinivorans]
MPLTLTLNGQNRTFEGLVPDSNLAELVDALGVKGDRVALELNGEIVSRARWAEASLANGDKVEMVHFVGGGSGA